MYTLKYIESIGQQIFSRKEYRRNTKASDGKDLRVTMNSSLVTAILKQRYRTKHSLSRCHRHGTNIDIAIANTIGDCWCD